MSEIKVAEVRLRVDSEEEVRAVIQVMQLAHGSARVALRAHAGREGAWFVRGTLQYEMAQAALPVPDTPVPACSLEQERPRPPATGVTKKLPETGRTKRLKR